MRKNISDFKDLARREFRRPEAADWDFDAAFGGPSYVVAVIKIWEIDAFIPKRPLWEHRNNDGRKNVPQWLQSDFPPSKTIDEPFNFRQLRVIEVFFHPRAF